MTGNEIVPRHIMYKILLCFKAQTTQATWTKLLEEASSQRKALVHDRETDEWELVEGVEPGPADLIFKG